MYFAVAKKTKKKHEKGYLKISFLEKSAINGATFSEFIIHFWEIVSLALSSYYWCDHKEKMVGIVTKKNFRSWKSSKPEVTGWINAGCCTLKFEGFSLLAKKIMYLGRTVKANITRLCKI